MSIGHQSQLWALVLQLGFLVCCMSSSTGTPRVAAGGGGDVPGTLWPPMGGHLTLRPILLVATI